MIILKHKCLSIGWFLQLEMLRGLAMSKNVSVLQGISTSPSSLRAASEQPDQQVPEGVCQKRGDWVKDLVIETQLSSFTSCICPDMHVLIYLFMFTVVKCILAIDPTYFSATNRSGQYSCQYIAGQYS